MSSPAASSDSTTPAGTESAAELAEATDSVAAAMAQAMVVVVMATEAVAMDFVSRCFA